MTEKKTETGYTEQLIPLKNIKPSPFNATRRASYVQAELDSLAANIRGKGILQPLLVRPMETEKYEIVFGERRFIASGKAGLSAVPCRVMKLNDAEAAELCIIENLQRQDSPASVEAQRIKALLDKGVLNIDQIAVAWGKTPTWVAQRAALVNLIPPLTKLLDRFSLYIQHWMLIARLSPEDQKNFFNREFAYDGGEEAWFYNMKIKSLGELLQRDYFMTLDKVPWDLEDEKLLPKAGACSKCPKRSSAQTILFPELAKTDSCTDNTCFKQKLDALRQQKIEKARKDNPDISIVSTERQLAEQKKVPHVYEDELKKVPASTPGAKKVLDLATGKIFHTGKAADSTEKKLAKGEKAKPKKKAPLVERLQVHECKRWKIVSSHLVEILTGKKFTWPSDRKIPDALRLIVTAGLDFHMGNWEETWKQMASGKDPMPWFVDCFHEDGFKCLKKQVADTIDFKNLTLAQLEPSIPDLTRCAEFFHIDIMALKNKADLECPLPKGLAKELAESKAKK